jgi:hypothetical protein
MPGTAGDCDVTRFRVGLWDAALVEAAGYFFKLNTNLVAGARTLISWLPSGLPLKQAVRTVPG